MFRLRLVNYYSGSAVLYCDLVCKPDVEYQRERSNVHSQKRQDKFETNYKIKRKQKEQRLGINEILNKTGME